MAGRTDFFFRQKVSEAELDLAFELLERADRNLAADIGVYGIISGAAPTQHSPVPDLTIDLTAPARAYDNLGQRIFFGTGQVVDCSVDLTGIPTEVPVAGQERWLGLFLRFDRLLSDPRTDGNSQQVFFRRDESFEFVVRQGPLGPVGGASKVPIMPDELLVCDILRKNAQTQILAPDIDVSRRQAFIFAQGDAVEIVSGVWSILAPAVNTVQAALDSVDAILTEHLDGNTDHHTASHVGYTPHGFVSATNVQGAIDELVDDLGSSTAGSPGSSKVGADTVAGSPNSLPTGTVDGQLSQLLTWLNSHQGAATGAHNASAIAALAHNYIAGANVQAQLQEIVTDLLSQTAGTPGASRIGADAVSGSPNSLAAGSVDTQLSTLLADVNAHLNAASGAHPAMAVSVADTGGNLNAANVEAALAEIADTLEGDHYRANEDYGGWHRTIRQPTIKSGMGLLLDSRAAGADGTHLRVYADSDSIWFVLNASWNGSAWARDSVLFYCGGFRFSRNDFELLHEDTFSATFTSWNRRWRISYRDTPNSSFWTTGAIEDTGRCGIESYNTAGTNQNMGMGGAVTFRSRLPAAPSSLTFSAVSRGNFSGDPSPWALDRDGFGFYSFQPVPAASAVFWYGSYTAVA